MAFVCKQTAVLVSTSITLDNNNAVLTDLLPFYSLNTLTHSSVGLTSCISIVFSVLNILTLLTTMPRVGSLKVMLTSFSVHFPSVSEHVKHWES